MVNNGDTKVLPHTQPNQGQHTPVTITTVTQYVGGKSESMISSHMVEAHFFAPLMPLFSDRHLSFCSAALCKPAV